MQDIRASALPVEAQRASTVSEIPAIKAIPTKYGGTTYRSRLEARWRVLFDALEIAADYEPEGFELADGTRYLPDFYLPHVRMFVEIKPVAFTAEERRKCLEITKAIGTPFLLLEGPPDFRKYQAVRRIDLESDPRPEIEQWDCLLDIDYHGRRLYRDQRRFFGDTRGEFAGREDFTHRYREAVDWSRDIRFDGSRW